MSIRDMVARRSKFSDNNDFFPTPPYATRALFEHVIPNVIGATDELSIWDPACGAGHMSAVFEEYGFKDVRSSDIVDYGYPGTKVERFQEASKYQAVDLVVTNPPYGDMAEFVSHGLRSASTYLAFLTRIQFLEGQGRYANIFSVTPPAKVAVFSDRIPFKMNVTTNKAPKMFTHCWVVWDIANPPRKTEVLWIPPDAQAKLQKIESDYDEIN